MKIMVKIFIIAVISSIIPVSIFLTLEDSLFRVILVIFTSVVIIGTMTFLFGISPVERTSIKNYCKELIRSKQLKEKERVL